MVETNIDVVKKICDTSCEAPLEIAKRIHSYFSYWHKWELTRIKIDHPEIYEEVLAEYTRLKEAKESAHG